jgi:hypothetical protein
MGPATNDPIDDAIRAMLDRIAARDAAMRDAVLEDIRRNGSRWAADEIIRLRRDLAAARAALRRAKQ